MTNHADRLHRTKLATAQRIVAQFNGAPRDWAAEPLINDAAVYVDPARHALERRKLFRETPVVACLSSDLPGPGSFRTFDDTGVPIVIIRGRDGVARGFLNICAHRGARLVRETEGKTGLMTCWFHAWSFNAEGRLAGVPERAGFADCVGDRDLVAVPVAERLGLVFVQATPGSTMDVDALLGDFAPELAMLELDRAERVKTGILPVAANWKYALDTYGEGYHFAALHRETIAPHFRADIQIYDRFGPHHRIMWPAKPMIAWLDQPETAWDVDHMIGWVHYIYPNTILFTGGVTPGRGYYTLFRHFPGEKPGETVTYKTIYAPFGVQSEEHRAEVEMAYDATAHVVENEDYIVAREGWANLAIDAANRTVMYGRQEVALQNYHKAVAAAIGVPGPRPVIHADPHSMAAE
jgi:phenylpropionate dioxygenase-like ring-hydroxylating dioxygenase large terminal subunit